MAAGTNITTAAGVISFFLDAHIKEAQITNGRAARAMGIEVPTTSTAVFGCFLP